MRELEHHCFATSNNWMDEGTDQQQLLTSQKEERQRWHATPWTEKSNKSSEASRPSSQQEDVKGTGERAELHSVQMCMQPVKSRLWKTGQTNKF